MVDLDKEKWWTHAVTDSPKCPHCDHDYEIDDHQAWHLYDPTEDEHEIECPACEKTYIVKVRVKYSFSTDEQPDEDE